MGLFGGYGGGGYSYGGFGLRRLLIFLLVIATIFALVSF
ncbi:sporulation protein YjcZ [Kroppenstedtia pulmonis]|nr:sporulation protein YjcZ [Kroppenstedtia pulmonis]